MGTYSKLLSSVPLSPIVTVYQPMIHLNPVKSGHHSEKVRRFLSWHVSLPGHYPVYGPGAGKAGGKRHRGCWVAAFLILNRECGLNGKLHRFIELIPCHT